MVSLLGLSSGLIEVQVKVTDPAGLTSVTPVEVRRREPGHSKCYTVAAARPMKRTTVAVARHGQGLSCACAWPPGGGGGQREQQ